MKLKVSVLLVIILIMGLFTGCKGSDKVKIAVVGPLTGDFAEYGTGFKNAVQLQIDEWNEKGGVLGKEVSLGMQKIIMNVRGILKKGDIIIFDEPLAGLDSQAREKIIRMINELTKGKTVIVITHDKEILRIMDKVIDLNRLQSKPLVS